MKCYKALHLVLTVFLVPPINQHFYKVPSNDLNQMNKIRVLSTEGCVTMKYCDVTTGLKSHIIVFHTVSIMIADCCLLNNHL